MNETIKKNNITIIGEGEKTLLFGHGFGCEKSMWHYITPAFEKDYRLVLFDYVGSGGSDLSEYDSLKYSTLDGYKQDVLDVIEALDLKKVTFIGHSVSSMIGMLSSLEKPDYFENLIMIGPSPCYLNTKDGYNGGFDESDVNDLLEMMEMNFSGWASYMAPIGMQKDKDSVQTKQLENIYISNDPSIAVEFAKATFFSDCRKELPLSKVPTLIMQCSEDSIVPLEVGEYLNKNLKNSTMHVMKAKGHYPHISSPEETIEMIKNYLDSGN
ncbi:MAG: alpha/beta hydrolase [Carnobacterium sp.]|nr:alpha/beta hydrolase [Carnobacterium sp.]